MIPKTMIIWVKQDLFHSWKRWKKFANQIPKSKIELIDMKKWKDGSSAGAYQKYKNEIGRAILMFLGHPDPYKANQKISTDVYKLELDVQGKTIQKKQLLIFEDDTSLQNKGDSEQNEITNIIANLKKILEQASKSEKEYQNFTSKVLKNDKELFNLVRKLPSISYESIKTNPV